MRIGIFGGCFNPPHKMHVSLALELIGKYVDQVIFVPAGDRYQKRGLLANEKRLEMLSLALKKYPNLSVSSYELNTELTYTYQTLDHFQKEYPNDEIYFILGADNLDEFTTWRNYEYILKTYKMLVIKRGNYDLNELCQRYDKYLSNIIFTDVKPHLISSTYIRNHLNDPDIGQYLDSDVLNYIQQNHLYEGSMK